MGVLLVAGSVAGVLAIVGAADSSVRVYAAAADLSPGQTITVRDLELTGVRMDGGEGLYLSEAGMPAGGLVVQRTVRAGELVPLSAVGRVEGERFAAVVLEVADGLSGSIEPGSLVDVWAAGEISSDAYGPPRVLVSAATVVRLTKSEGFVDDGTRSVEVLVPRDRIAQVLEAMANENALSLVPVSIPLEG